jgi:hypothetical protein
MKKIHKVLAVSTLLLGAYTAQAHLASQEHQHGDLYNKVHAMPSGQQTDFKQMMHDNMDKMSAPEKQAFMQKMRSTQGLDGVKQNNMHRKTDARNTVNTMSTMERAGFINMMRSNMNGMSDVERHSFFDYMGFDEQERHGFFKRMGIKHDQKESRGYGHSYGTR